MKVAFVTPRYGAAVLGGAETGARRVAELLAARSGWVVEALTTCALDERTWADQYEPGGEDLNGVHVQRFPVTSPRASDFDACSARVLADPEAAEPRAQEAWLHRQGPVAPALLDAVAASDADVLVLTPYLFHPTVRGLGCAGVPTVLVPAAHDEAPIRLPMYRDVFAGAGGLVFHSEAEQRFVNATFPVAHHPQVVIGLGSEPRPGTPEDAGERHGLGDRPYLLCLGRVDAGKGSLLLSQFFTAYKQRRPGPLTLVFSGPVSDPPPAHPDIIVTGPVDETTKWGLLRGAVALVSPSVHESFSIVLLEAWDAGVPVLVNARCAPTREQCLRSGGGLWFDAYRLFEVAVDRLVESPELRVGLASRGRRYVEANYRWPHVTDRYADFLTRIADG